MEFARAFTSPKELLVSISLATHADTLLELHQPGNPVVLPTVWDAWSAKLAVDAGFAALTVGSHPVADSIGKQDGEGMEFSDLLTRVRQITDAVDVPVSVDIESGYGLPAEDLVAGLLDSRAVGLNIEDTVHREGGRFRSAEEHAELVARLRTAADRQGVHVVVNARTDLFKNQVGDESDRVERAVARMTLAAEAGADCLYPVGFHPLDVLARLADELPLPVNALGRPGEDDLSEIAAAGAGRVSFGPLWQMELGKVSNELLARWRRS